MRDRIDWENLAPLPRKARQDGATREELAERKFHASKAKHKGRNHFHSHQRRQMRVASAAKVKKRAAYTVSKVRKHIDAVRAYWRGESDEHP